MIRASRVIAVVLVVGLSLAAWALDGSDAPDVTDTSTSSIPVRDKPTTSAVVEEPLGATSTVPAAPAVDDRPIEAGLAAWGRFAVTGEVDELAGWFAADGPQMDRFRSEAPELASNPIGAPAYIVTFDEEGRSEEADELRVEGDVRFVRTGEPTQSFDWTIVLRRDGARWVIWTVEETGAG